MRAAVHNRYGPPEVVSIRQTPDPAPGPGEVLVRVEAGTVCAPDWRFRSAQPALIRLVTGLTRPARDRVLGFEFAGVVAGLGAGVTRLAIGDRVFGTTGTRLGAHAERLTIKDGPSICRRPENLNPAEAAALSYGGVTALHFLRAARAGPGQRVLVHGASGGVGTAMIQVARALGATVTAVASGANLDFVRSLGAHAAINRETTDFAAAGTVHDIVADCVGGAGLTACLRATTSGGAVIQVNPTLADMAAGLWRGASRGIRVISGVALEKPGDLEQLAAWATEGLVRPPIGRSFAFDDIVEAHRYAQSGAKRGHAAVIIG
jgi:NADPH:quinone reductase-like Zn-dependent oxidoreductase